MKNIICTEICSPKKKYSLKGQFWTSNLLIFFLSVTNYHKLRSLKQHRYIRSQFLWVRSLGSVSWVFCSSAPQTVVQVLGRAGVSSRSEEPLGSSCSCWQKSLPCRYRTHGGCIFKARSGWHFTFFYGLNWFGQVYPG